MSDETGLRRARGAALLHSPPGCPGPGQWAIPAPPGCREASNAAISSGNGPGRNPRNFLSVAGLNPHTLPHLNRGIVGITSSGTCAVTGTMSSPYLKDPDVQLMLRVER